MTFVDSRATSVYSRLSTITLDIYSRLLDTLQKSGQIVYLVQP